MEAKRNFNPQFKWGQRYKTSNQVRCASKLSFPSHRDAASWNRHTMRRISQKRLEPTHVYRCLSCKQYHIGHEVKQRDNTRPIGYRREKRNWGQ